MTAPAIQFKPQTSDKSTANDIEDSRKELQKTLSSRRADLTGKEYNFLTKLAEDGNESQVKLALSKLSDNNLFFKLKDEGRKNTEKESERKDCANGSESKLVGGRSEGRGSAKRSSFLAQRMNSDIYDKLWKAHDHGISFRRRKLIKSSSRRELLLKYHELGLPLAKLSQYSSTQTFYCSDISRQNNCFRGRRRPVTFSPTIKEKSSVFQEIVKIDNDEDETTETGVTSKSDAKSDTSSDFSFPPIVRATPLRGSSLYSSASVLSELGLSLKDLSPLYDSFHFSGSGIKSDTTTIKSLPHIAGATPLRNSSVLSSESLISDDEFNSKDLEIACAVSDQSTPKNLPKCPNIPRHAGGLEDSDQSTLGSLPKLSGMPQPVLLREASANSYSGQGIEAYEATRLESLSNIEKCRSLLTSSPRKDRFSFSRFSSNSAIQSQDDLEIMSTKTSDFDCDTSCGDLSQSVSWDPQPSSRDDAWAVLEDGENTLPFRILGTGVNDESAKPHVLSPPLMESLKSFLPFKVAENNFWLRFSLVRDRDGPSLQTLMKYVCGTSYTILAVETVDGEVFGSFTSTPWTKQPNFYGADEAFLWKMRQNRRTPRSSILDQARLESNLDVYPWTGKNNFVRYFSDNIVALGKGEIDEVPPDFNVSLSVKNSGFGIALYNDLLMGSSDPCATFDNPRLAFLSDDGVFEVANIEVWALTPHMSEEEVEKHDFSSMFFKEAWKE